MGWKRLVVEDYGKNKRWGTRYGTIQEFGIRINITKHVYEDTLLAGWCGVEKNSGKVLLIHINCLGLGVIYNIVRIPIEDAFRLNHKAINKDEKTIIVEGQFNSFEVDLELYENTKNTVDRLIKETTSMNLFGMDTFIMDCFGSSRVNSGKLQIGIGLNIGSMYIGNNFGARTLIGLNDYMFLGDSENKNTFSMVSCENLLARKITVRIDNDCKINHDDILSDFDIDFCATIELHINILDEFLEWLEKSRHLGNHRIKIIVYGVELEQHISYYEKLLKCCTEAFGFGRSFDFVEGELD